MRYRGHLDNISNNTLTGAVNAFNNETNSVKNQLTGEYGEVPAVQREYKAAVSTVVVGDSNYGEGSSREHAAMQPRFLGVTAVLVKLVCAIHETNLKKQGMLGLTFANEADYDLIQEDRPLPLRGFGCVCLASRSPLRWSTRTAARTPSSRTTPTTPSRLIGSVRVCIELDQAAAVIDPMTKSGWEFLPDRAIWWPSESTLIVSDLHLGKRSFSSPGIAVPNAVNANTLERLSALVSSHRPRRLLVLGDLFHSEENKEWLEFQACWRP